MGGSSKQMLKTFCYFNFKNKQDLEKSNMDVRLKYFFCFKKFGGLSLIEYFLCKTRLTLKLV